MSYRTRWPVGTGGKLPRPRVNSRLIAPAVVDSDPNQTLTQSAIFENSNTFYTHVLTPPIQALTQTALFENANSFFTHTLTATIALTQSARHDNANSFFTHTLSVGAVALTQTTRFDNSNSFFTHTLTPGAVALTQSAIYANDNTFYTHVLSQGGAAQDLTQDTRLDNSNSFFTHALTATIALTQSARHDNSNSFFTHVLSASIGLTQTTRFDNSNSFFTHTLTPGVVALVQSARFDNENSFFAHSLSQEGGPQALTQDSIFANENTFFEHILALAGGEQPSGGWPIGYFPGYRRKRLEVSTDNAKIVPRQHERVERGTLLEVWGFEPADWAEILPDLPQRIYEELAIFAQSVRGTAAERQLQKLCRRLFEAREVTKAALLQMWGDGLSNASSRLLQAIVRAMAMQGLPFGSSQSLETPEELQVRIAAAQQQIATRKKIRQAEARDRYLTEEIRSLLDDQDRLKLGIAAVEQKILEANMAEDELALVLALAS